MPFSDFSNPFRTPADAPEVYRTHLATSKLWKADGTYVRPAEDPINAWAIDILPSVPLQAIVAEAKARDERMILSEKAL